MNRRSYVGAGLVAALLLLFSAATATPTQAVDGAWDIGDVIIAGCDNFATELGVYIVNPTDAVFNFTTVVQVGSDVYMAQYFTDAVSGATNWFLFATDDFGIVNATWPIPANTPFEVILTLHDENDVPIYATRLTIGNCEAGNIIEQISGPVTTVVYNGDFEDAGVNNKDAARWDEAGTNDFRKCNKDKSDPPDGDFNDPEDKVFARNGECAFRFKGTAGTNDKLTQTFPLPLFAAGDTLVTQFYANANNLSGGQLLVKVNYADGTKDKLKRDIADGTYDWQYYADTLTFTQPVETVTTQFRVKNGAGRLQLDDVQVTVYTRTLPLVLETPPNDEFVVFDMDNQGNIPSGSGVTLPDAPSIDGVRGN